MSEKRIGGYRKPKPCDRCGALPGEEKPDTCMGCRYKVRRREYTRRRYWKKLGIDVDKEPMPDPIRGFHSVGEDVAVYGTTLRDRTNRAGLERFLAGRRKRLVKTCRGRKK